MTTNENEVQLTVTSSATDESAPHHSDEEETQTLQNVIKNSKKMINHVTLEPMLCLKMIAEGNILVVGNALQTDRICRVNLNYTQQDCLLMDDGNHSEIQEAVQVYQNTFNYYQSLMDSILPIIVVLFAGSISDQHGRKLPMIIVLVGFLLYALVYIFLAIDSTWPVEVLYAATLAVDITGTWAVFNMAVYSYITDVTPRKTRVKRMSLLDAVWYSGGPIGTWMGGWLYQKYDYIAVFTVSAVLWFICILYVIIFVKESVVTGDSSPKENPFRKVIDLVRTSLKSYPKRGRLHLMILMALKLGAFLVQGHQVYLWARRVLRWDATQFSYWFGTNKAVHQVGMMAWVGLASYYHFSEFVVAKVALVSVGLWSVTLACIISPTLWWLTIVATILGMFGACIEPALRTLITSIPDKKDIGKIFAFLGLLESVGLIVDQSIYTYLYNTHVETFPQINFVVASAVTIVMILVLVVLEKDWPEQRKTTEG